MVDSWPPWEAEVFWSFEAFECSEFAANLGGQKISTRDPLTPTQTLRPARVVPCPPKKVELDCNAVDEGTSVYCIALRAPTARMADSYG